MKQAYISHLTKIVVGFSHTSPRFCSAAELFKRKVFAADLSGKRNEINYKKGVLEKAMKNQTNSGSGEYKNRTVHNLIILDESGSMEIIKQATITGFNEVVQTIKGVEESFPEQTHFVSLVTFNGLGIDTKLFAKKVKNLRELDGETFQPDASTPLYDAIGFSVTKLRKKIAAESCDVLVTIITDGEENASREYTGAAVKKLIDEMKKQGWTFTYIGANHDVEQVAYSLSITNSLKFEANETDVKRAFDHDKKARHIHAAKLRYNENVQERYFEDADDEN